MFLAKDSKTEYPLKSNTLYIATESVTGGSDVVYIHLYTDSGDYIKSITWKFRDWGYRITYCSAANYSLKFPVTPPTGINKNWEITITPEYVKVKCNNLEVLHFIFNNTYNVQCTSLVKGKKAAKVIFPESEDTATKMLRLVGKVV